MPRAKPVPGAWKMVAKVACMPLGTKDRELRSPKGDLLRFAMLHVPHKLIIDDHRRITTERLILARPPCIEFTPASFHAMPMHIRHPILLELGELLRHLVNEDDLWPPSQATEGLPLTPRNQEG